MSDLTQQRFTVIIDGEEHPYSLNMAALDAISEHGYSGEDGQGDFGQAFADAENGNVTAQRLVAWAGLLPAYQDAEGCIDYEKAPPLSITNRMTFGEVIMASAVGSSAFIASLPAGAIEAAVKAAEEREEAEKAGRPTEARTL